MAACERQTLSTAELGGQWSPTGSETGPRAGGQGPVWERDLNWDLNVR